jgi:hypothetical protein
VLIEVLEDVVEELAPVLELEIVDDDVEVLVVELDAEVSWLDDSERLEEEEDEVTVEDWVLLWSVWVE